jgi:signal transduction histidine kinase
MSELGRQDRRIPRHAVHLAVVLAWFGVTLALAIWWLVHGIEQIRALSAFEPQLAERFSAQHRMMLWEGSTFIALLVLGAIGFIVLLSREARRHEQMKAFFGTFTHELKTPLASLRLQAEAIQEEIEDPSTGGGGNGVRRLVSRLLDDASRLELQMENSLFLATARDSDQIHLEAIELSSVVERMRSSFPGIEIHLMQDAVVQADRRAIEGVLKNLIQNSRVHGGATRIEINPRSDGDRVAVRVGDNGSGFKGDLAAAGKLFYRHTPTSGSGVGLHLCRLLVERMGGRLELVRGAERGFAVDLTLREARVG